METLDEEIEKFIIERKYNKLQPIFQTKKGKFKITNKTFQTALNNYNENIFGLLCKYYEPKLTHHYNDKIFEPMELIKNRKNEKKLLTIIDKMVIDNNSVTLGVVKHLSKDMMNYYFDTLYSPTKHDQQIRILFKIVKLLSANMDMTGLSKQQIFKKCVDGNDTLDLPDLAQNFDNVMFPFFQVTSEYFKIMTDACIIKSGMVGVYKFLINDIYIRKMLLFHTQKRNMTAAMIYQMYPDAINYFDVKSIICLKEYHQLVAHDYKGTQEEYMVDTFYKNITECLIECVHRYDPEAISFHLKLFEILKFPEECTKAIINQKVNRDKLLIVAYQLDIYHPCFETEMPKDAVDKIEKIQKKQMDLKLFEDMIPIGGVQRIILKYVGFLSL